MADPILFSLPLSVLSPLIGRRLFPVVLGQSFNVPLYSRHLKPLLTLFHLVLRSTPSITSTLHCPFQRLMSIVGAIILSCVVLFWSTIKNPTNSYVSPLRKTIHPASPVTYRGFRSCTVIFFTETELGTRELSMLFLVRKIGKELQLMFLLDGMRMILGT